MLSLPTRREQGEIRVERILAAPFMIGTERIPKGDPYTARKADVSPETLAGKR
jgi:hypothetical protein